MDDLLKDAIADAKAVRETALANAKIALEEAFTPRLKSMLSQKIQNELEHEDDEEVVGVEEDDVEDDVEGDEEEVLAAQDEVPGDEASEEEPEIAAEPEEGEEELEVEEDEELEVEPAVEEEGVIEINGVKYAPIVSEEDEEVEEESFEEQDEDELDLEAILRELEDEVEEDEIEEDYDEAGTEDGLASDEVETADEAELAEDLADSSEIGAGDNKVDDDSADSSEVGQGSEEPSDSADEPEGEEDDNLEVVDDLTEGEDEEDVEEEIDLEEILRALSEQDEDEEEEAAEEQVKHLSSELAEHRKVVKYLRSKLNEVNLLNAKLLFTNKLFRSFGLTNEQKLKVVENFDRALNLREVKLVFATLAESFGGSSSAKPIKERKGAASKPVASTKPKSKEVIEEGFELKERFKKLARILN